MIGLGSQDSFAEAQDFRTQYGTVSFPMLWDPTFVSWLELGIRSQPAGVLATRDGTLLADWLGPIPEEQVLEIVAELG